MTYNEIKIFSCKCKLPAKYRLTFDGGSTGHYIVELCKKCYEQEKDKRFLISEEILEKRKEIKSVE